MTETNEAEPVCTVHSELLSAVVYDDGETVTAGEGDVYCSEHGNLNDKNNQRQCNHDYSGELKATGLTPDPTIHISEFYELALAERSLLETAVEEYIERYPEDAAKLFKQFE